MWAELCEALFLDFLASSKEDAFCGTEYSVSDRLTVLMDRWEITTCISERRSWCGMRTLSELVTRCILRMALLLSYWIPSLWIQMCTVEITLKYKHNGKEIGTVSTYWKLKSKCSFLDDLRRELERKNTNHKVILLTHFPLYRVNDLNCGDLRSNERGHITYLDPASRYQKHRHVLSPPLSKYLLDTIRPSLVLSGHTHAYCAQHHRVESMNGFPMNISEYTIPSFAWSQRPDPSYAVLNLDFSISPELQLCHLPDERFIATICLLFISVCLLKYVKTLGPISSNKNRIAQSHFRTTQSVHKVSESELRTENVLWHICKYITIL